jgi:hypothetical protein
MKTFAEKAAIDAKSHAGETACSFARRHYLTPQQRSPCLAHKAFDQPCRGRIKPAVPTVDCLSRVEGAAPLVRLLRAESFDEREIEGEKKAGDRRQDDQ